MDPIIGQIQAFGFGFAPLNWAFCNGQLLPISENAALYSLLGTVYGGDGQTTFALPDLRGRTMVHCGQGPGLDQITQGEVGGQSSVTLTQQNLPAHTHTLTNGVAKVNVFTSNNSNSTNESDNGANGLGTGGAMPDIFRESPTTADFVGGVTISGQVDPAGSSTPISIQNPYLGIYVSIALQGIYPSRS